MIYSIIIILACVATYLYYQSLKIKSKSVYKKIPEEPGLPIIGVLHKVENSITNYFIKLNKKHGPIYQVKLGMRNMVVLNSFEYIKKALIGNGDIFSGRWKLMNYIFVCNDSGVSYIDGTIWSEHRSYLLKILKDIGIGKSQSVEIIQNECLYLMKDIEKLKSKVGNISSFISLYLANVICKFIMNRRFNHEDEEMKIMEKTLAEVGIDNDPVSTFSLLFPFLDDRPWIMKFIVWVSSRKALFDKSHKMFENIIEEHRSQLDINSEGEDLIDKLLIKQHQIKSKNGDVGNFTNFHIVRDALDLLIASYDTTTTTIVWSFQFLSMYPEIQNKVYREILDQIGSERLPTMSDKKSLNFVQAVMDEVLRLSSIIPLSLLRRTLNDCSIDGYFIPKDTLITTNLFAYHIDPNTWEKPLEFYPEHFLKKDNDEEWRYNPREELIAFGMGKRQCLGESLARMEYFIFLTSIVQRFQINFSKEVTKPEKLDIFRGSGGIIRTTEFQNYIFTKRY